MEEWTSISIGSAVGQNETAGPSHDHRVLYRLDIPEYSTLHDHRCENLKSYITCKFASREDLQMTRCAT
jgi:hypothetical protein